MELLFKLHFADGIQYWLSPLSVDKLNRDLQRLSNWATQWLITYNQTKTKHLEISKKLQPQNYDKLGLTSATHGLNTG